MVPVLILELFQLLEPLKNRIDTVLPKQQSSLR